jgi:DNA-directed RNA polymerase specialized sigma subunit
VALLRANKGKMPLHSYRIFLLCLKAQLSCKEIEVIMFRYSNGMTLKKTGEIILKKVSKQRVLQIEKKALNKLKKELEKKYVNEIKFIVHT